jgi:hypothetical protein
MVMVTQPGSQASKWENLVKEQKKGLSFDSESFFIMTHGLLRLDYYQMTCDK